MRPCGLAGVVISGAAPTRERNISTDSCVFIGVVERLSIEPAGTFEFALWCKLLRDRGHTGQQVARLLGKSEGYVNNLVRIIERGSLRVLERWCREQRSEPRVCATDWLMQVCVLPHEVQDAQLAERLARVAL